MTIYEYGDDQQKDILALVKTGWGADRSGLEVIDPLLRRTEISLLDVMTIRDLLAWGGHGGDLPLSVLLIAMFAALQEGSLCLDLVQKKVLNRLPEDIRDKTGDAIDAFVRRLDNGHYGNLVTRNGDEFMPLILDASRGRRLLYFQKYYIHEQGLKDLMERFLAASVSLQLTDQVIEDLLEDMYSDPHVIRVGPSQKPITRDPRQTAAIRLGLKSQFAIVSGGPGTGKTSLMVNILRSLVRAGVPVSRIVLGAPTGRAAQRMTETVQKNIGSILAPTAADRALLDLEGSTLHKILRYRSHDHDFYYREGLPVPASVIVIDEVSMVDVAMMDRFLQAIDPETTKLILLGDKDQLPSVEAGAVFAEMIPDGTRAEKFKDRFIVLEKVFRSGARLRKLAEQTNKGGRPAVTPVSFEVALVNPPDRWAFVHQEGADRWHEHLKTWATHHYLESDAGQGSSYSDAIAQAGTVTADGLVSSDTGRTLLQRIFNGVERARILSFLRGGAYGCTVINRWIASHLIDAVDPSAVAQTSVFTGALVIITRNDYSKALFNGDVGVMIKDADETYRVFFHRSGTYTSLPVSLLPAWELAFAMTVHKSQGSEFDDVLLVLPDDETHRLLTREIVYTGITRAKKRVILYGTETALDTALNRKIERQSGLMW